MIDITQIKYISEIQLAMFAFAQIKSQAAAAEAHPETYELTENAGVY